LPLQQSESKAESACGGEGAWLEGCALFFVGRLTSGWGMGYDRGKEIVMEARLTLKLDKALISSAKKYAENHNRSLSKLVENYFIHISSAPKTPKKYPPLIEELSGILSESDLEQFSKEDARARYILTRKI
jgi:hypothetical protein